MHTLSFCGRKAAGKKRQETLHFTSALPFHIPEFLNFAIAISERDGTLQKSFDFGLGDGRPSDCTSAALPTPLCVSRKVQQSLICEHQGSRGQFLDEPSAGEPFQITDRRIAPENTKYCFLGTK